MDLSSFPRRRYTPFATPIEFLPNLTKAVGGPNIYIKRDDMLGLFPGGNKTRKLEFLVADALAQGADTLITCGAPQSNHCRITLTAAAKEGLKCRMVIEERIANSYDENANGNHFMFRLMGVEDITVVPAGTNMPEAMQKVADDLKAKGRKGYIVPGGGSNPIGALESPAHTPHNPTRRAHSSRRRARCSRGVLVRRVVPRLAASPPAYRCPPARP